MGTAGKVSKRGKARKTQETTATGATAEPAPFVSGRAHVLPLRIVIGCDTFAPDINGAARFAERLAAGLVARGHDVHVVAPGSAKRKHGVFRERIEREKLTVHRLPSHRMQMHEWLRFVLPWRATAHARRLLDQLQPDIVHIQSHFLIGRALIREAAKRNIPVVATNHVMPENIVDLWAMPKWLRSVVVRLGWADVDRVLRIASRVTSPTQRAADLLEKHTSRRNVLPISCGIDGSQYQAILDEKPEKRVVFVGRMTQEKHVDVLVRALARLDESVKLDLVGKGDERKNLEQLVRELGVEHRVVFHGKLEDAQLREILTKGSVFAIASIAELQSIATLEAMASGLPVVVANAAALPHLVEGNGFLFEPGDDAECAQHLRTILQLPHAEYVQLQRASLRKAKEHDIQKTFEAFESLYYEVGSYAAKGE